MTRLQTPTAEEEKGWADWVASLPDNLRKVAEGMDPWTLYRMASTGHRCSILSFYENEQGEPRLRVYVGAEWNLIPFARQVFDVKHTDLTPCDPPLPDEIVGEYLSPEQVDEFIDEQRLKARPDLWERGPDGRAVWKGEGPAPNAGE